MRITTWTRLVPREQVEVVGPYLPTDAGTGESGGKVEQPCAHRGCAPASGPPRTFPCVQSSRLPAQGVGSRWLNEANQGEISCPFSGGGCERIGRQVVAARLEPS